MTVEVTDPKHPRSAHPATFLGQVCYCDQDHACIKDHDDHTYNVYLDEILCLMNYKNSSSCYCLRMSEHGYDVVCILPTGMVETLASSLDITTALYVIELFSTPRSHQPLAA
jgi:hypothetical protein|tara:strand:+ start:4107 stop:4442 length:336 start_codon:yes stop_codon:yes gene_type:complete